MLDEQILRRLIESVVPDDRLRERVGSKIHARIQPAAFLDAVRHTVPDSSVRLRLKDRILRAIWPLLASDLQDLAEVTSVPQEGFAALRQAVLSRLQPIAAAPRVHSALRWAAAFAVFILLLRAMPLVFLAPTTRADVGVQLIPGAGEDVTIYVGGMWRVVDHPEILRGPVMVRTTGAEATIIFNDDGVLRLGMNTTLKLHEVSDQAQGSALGPTATLVRGKVWALGLLPPVLDSLSIDTIHGALALNSGSASLDEDGHRAVASVYDRGATFQHGKQVAFLVAGEEVQARGTSAFNIINLPASAFSKSWVSKNLEQDAVHRTETSKLLEERRAKMASILPTSFFYPAKRIAEEVDVLFTLTHDGRTEKRIQQADTRLSEAIALIREGQDAEAAVPLTEYRDSLIAMASGTGDNLVKFLVKKQIAEASSSLSTPQVETGANVKLVRDAVLGVSAAIPDTTLRARDIEGYVLVDTLAEINRTLTQRNYTGGLLAYAEVRPYLQGLLGEQGAHPLLQKEARSLLATTSRLIKTAPRDKLVAAAVSDIAQYLPPEQILVSDEELNGRVKEMVNRIFLFRHPRSRYNQLLLEMEKLRGDPSRGTLLRRLKNALPEGVGEYVNTEIKNLRDELEGK